MKYELTNQDSAGGNWTVLSRCEMYVDRKGVEVGQLFSLETASNIYEKECLFPETISDCKKWKMREMFYVQAINLALKLGNPRPASHLYLCMVITRQP